MIQNQKLSKDGNLKFDDIIIVKGPGMWDKKDQRVSRWSVVWLPFTKNVNKL